MSGDVQPRKRKDKKRKKDELGLEEPRGTAAVFGEGDVFMHSQHDHGTGGHWCAKVIFFSLLAILVTLIGLIILENRGLSELEANAVESRYSGVLEGWLEDAPDDDHHDEHTLELTHHDDDEGHEEHADNDDHNNDEEDEHDTNDEDEHSEEDEGNIDEDDHQLEEDDEDQTNENEDISNEVEDNNEDDVDNDEDDTNEENDDDDDEDQHEQDLKNDEDEDEEFDQDAYEADDDVQELDDDETADNDENNSNEIDRNDSEENDELNENEDEENKDDEHEEEDEDDQEVEVEKLEKEASEEDLEPVSTELPALPEEDDDDDNKDDDQSDEKEPEEEEDSGIENEGEEFLEIDDADEAPVEKISAPAGKPFFEVEEEESSEQPPDTLEEEEEYEKQQEQLRREEAQASHMWLKLGVGAALLVATHAVVRRATHSRDTPEGEEHASREESPIVDRRLTLIPEGTPAPVRKVEELSRPVVEKVVEKIEPIVKSIPIRKQESEEEEEEPQPSEDEEEEVVVEKSKKDKELYSDEETDEEVEEEEEEEIVPVKKEVPKQAPLVSKKPEPEPEPEPEEEDDEDPEDVEIIGDEQLEEELEEEGDEEEISDVDDAELLSRLEAKYGRLPDPERPGRKQKDGGNSLEDMWPGEPSDAYWRQQLDSAEQELRQGSWSSAAERAGAAELRGSARALFVAARALDLAAEARRDNRLLARAITAYLELLKMSDRLSDKKLLEISGRALDRIQFRGTYLNAEPVYRLLIRRFPNEPAHRNNLTISFLMANRVDLAENTIKETLQRWPNDRLALAHYGFVLKTKHNKYEEAAESFKKALEGDTGPANEPRFYYHYGDSLLLLGRSEEAQEVHKRGAKLGHFLSPSQRSLYNVNRLKGSPWWDIEQTPYLRLAKALEKSWKEILKEGEAAKALYEKEKEGLKERGDWSQLDLFVRGQEIPGRCARAPVTCGIVKSEPAAAGCRRGQVKFSAMAAGTHVRAHVGPTNCRLRMHLGLSNTKDTYIRVDKEIRQWQVGKVLMFDDSFEHEVWHNGTGARLVLIVDVWHPQLTAGERRQLPAI